MSNMQMNVQLSMQMSMQKFREAFEYLIKLSERVRRYPNEARTDAREGQGFDLDNMILTDPTLALNYFRFEYLLCAFFSFCILFVTVWFYLCAPASFLSTEHIFLYWWLLAGIIMHTVNIFSKALILNWLHRIPQTEALVARRLMLLIRSNLFYWNERISFFMYNFYVLGMCKLACSNICGSMRNGLYQLCYFIVCCFLLRLANLFVRFMVQYVWFTRNVHYDTIIDHGASAKEIAELPVDTYHSKEGAEGEDMEIQWCGICLEYFQDGDVVKKFPCAEQHYFHKLCTETWLKTHNVCPYCRRSLRK